MEILEKQHQPVGCAADSMSKKNSVEGEGGISVSRKEQKEKKKKEWELQPTAPAKLSA